jgi:hypothetical protein
VAQAAGSRSSASACACAYAYTYAYAYTQLEHRKKEQFVIDEIRDRRNCSFFGFRKIGKPGCVAFSHVDKTAAKLPSFWEELNSIARVSAGAACGAVRPACGVALG